MRIFSEKTNKEYATVEECQKAEKDFDTQKKVQEEKKAKLAENRKARAKEVEDAFQAIKDAEKKYVRLRNDFVKDYGSFHMTFSNSDLDSDELFDTIFRFL